MNKMEIDELKRLLEKEMHKVAAMVIKTNPLKNTSFAGFGLMQAVMDSGKVFKEEFKKEKEKTGLTESEIDEMVNEVSGKVLKKYISNL